MQNRLNQVKTTSVPTLLGTETKSNPDSKTRSEMRFCVRGFRYDIAHYYQILKKARQTPVLPHLTVRHEARALAIYIADDEFSREQLCAYLGVVCRRRATLTRIAEAYNVDYQKRDLFVREAQ